MKTGRFAPVGILHHQVIQETCDSAYELVASRVHQEVQESPWLPEDRATEAKEMLRTLRIVGGIKLHISSMASVMCSSSREPFTPRFLGQKFTLWGWGNTPVMARAMALQEIISNARPWMPYCPAILHSSPRTEIDHVVLKCSYEGKEPANSYSRLWIQRIPVEVVVVTP